MKWRRSLFENKTKDKLLLHRNTMLTNFCIVLHFCIVKKKSGIVKIMYNFVGCKSTVKMLQEKSVGKWCFFSLTHLLEERISTLSPGSRDWISVLLGRERIREIHQQKL